MSSLNKVIAGDYEGYSIIANAIVSPILAAKRQSSGLDIKADENDVEILLIPRNIKSYKIIPSKNEETQLVDVIFHDCKRSLLQLDNSAYETFIKKNFNLDADAAPKKPIILGAIDESDAQSLDKEEVKKDAVFSENKEFINIQQGKTVKGAKIYGSDHIPFYQKKWFVIICIFIFFPLGLALLLISKDFSKITKIIITLGFIGFIVYLCSLSGEAQKTAQSTSNTEETKEIVSLQSKSPEVKEEKKIDLASKIQKGADSPMTQESYPKTYKTWGKAYFNRLNEMMPKVALKAAESDKCDMVTWVGLSDSRSTPKKEAVFFADCKNGERFYISENDLKTDKKAESVKESTAKFNDSAYIEACADYAKRKMNHPSTFDYSFFNSVVYKAPTGRIVVTMPCEAKNSFNLEVEMEAKCYFDDRGMVDFSIQEK